jgi:ParB/RepB/Spo0J family partition protein
MNDFAAIAIPITKLRRRKPANQEHPDEIPVDQVRVNPEQPRKLFDKQEMAELTESVHLHGVLIPVLVERSLEGGYILHDGERRWRVAKETGLRNIPARILPPGADRNQLIHALVANLHTASMTIVEEAMAYRRLGEVYGYDGVHGSKEKIARLLGLSPVRVYNAMTVLKLAPAIQELFAARKLPNNSDVIRALLKIPNDEARLRLAEHLATLPNPPTIHTVKIACTRLINILGEVHNRRTGIENDHPPALRFSGHKPRDLWPEWDALYQLGKVPPWQVINNAVMATCGDCAMRPVASGSICRECPLVDSLRKMMKAVEK